MEAAKKSIYDTVLIESNDQKQRIDLRTSIVAFEYYEDIFSPIVTAKIKIVNTGNSASTEKDTSKQSLYNGLPLRGGERIAIKVRPNTKTNIPLDFANKIEIKHKGFTTSPITFSSSVVRRNTILTGKLSNSRRLSKNSCFTCLLLLPFPSVGTPCVQIVTTTNALFLVRLWTSFEMYFTSLRICLARGLALSSS